MSEPIRKYYISQCFLPAIEKLQSYIRRDRHLVLAFPFWTPETKRDQLVVYLKNKLPENFIVFDAGGSKYWQHITIKQVISEQEVNSIIPGILVIAKEFKKQSEWLAKEIARLNDISIEALWEKTGEIEIFPAGWKCYHHGQHYCCEKLESGQLIEVPIWYGEEFGILDPYFFSKYIDSTPSLEMPPGIIDWYHDMSRVMDIMLNMGLMKHIQGTTFDVCGIALT